MIAGQGDQSDPSISGNWIVFASSVAGDRDVLRYAIGAPAGSAQVIADDPGDQDQPDVHGTIVAHRAPGGVFVRDWTQPAPIRAPGGAGAACGPLAPESRPTVGASLAAWECGAEGSRSIAVLRYQDGVPEYRLARPGVGEQYAPAAHGSLVAFVDGADGASVWLHDSSAGPDATVPVCGGAATGVAVGDIAGRTILAATRRTGGPDADVEVWEPSLLVTALRVPGEQRNPHVSGDWVAFEDLSTEASQVVLWQWTTGLVFLPHPSASDQTLNDLATIPGSEVRAVFAEDAGGGMERDIALYRLVLDANGNVPDDGTPNTLPWDPLVPPPDPAARASCDDVDPVVLATLVVERARGRPRAGSVEFQATAPGDGAPMPVLVCLEATRVSAGWMTLDDEAIAWPHDFEVDRAHVAIPAVASGRSRLAAVIGGKPGARLVVRVLADPGRPPPDCGGGDDDGDDDDDDGDDDVAGRAQHVDSGREWDHDGDDDHDQGFGNAGWREVTAARFDRRVCDTRRVPQPVGGGLAHGCATGGEGGAFAILALLAAARLRRRR